MPVEPVQISSERIDEVCSSFSLEKTKFSRFRPSCFRFSSRLSIYFTGFIILESRAVYCSQGEGKKTAGTEEIDGEKKKKKMTIFISDNSTLDVYKKRLL